MKTVRGSLLYYQLTRVCTKSGWSPSLDLYDRGDELVVLVELAGVRAKDVEVTVARERVQVRGNRCRPLEREITRIHRMEIDFGAYDQSIALPEPVDPEGASSTYRDGFLRIRLPKEVKVAGSKTEAGKD